MNELDLMGRLQHPNIVRLREYFLQDDPALPHCGACIIVMDLLRGSDLMDYFDDVGGLSREDVNVRTPPAPRGRPVCHGCRCRMPGYQCVPCRRRLRLGRLLPVGWPWPRGAVRSVPGRGQSATSR